MCINQMWARFPATFMTSRTFMTSLHDPPIPVFVSLSPIPQLKRPPPPSTQCSRFSDDFQRSNGVCLQKQKIHKKKKTQQKKKENSKKEIKIYFLFIFPWATSVVVQQGISYHWYNTLSYFIVK